MSKFVKLVKSFVKEEDAPTMVEYGLLVAVIALIVVAGAAVFGTKLSTLFNGMGGSLS